MRRRFSKDSNFKDLLRRNKNAIVYATLNGLEATDNFKRMRSLIIAMSDKYSNNSFKYIVISEQDLQNLTHNATMQSNCYLKRHCLFRIVISSLILILRLKKSIMNNTMITTKQDVYLHKCQRKKVSLYL